MNLKRIILAVVIVTLSFLLPIKAAKVPLEWDDENPRDKIRGWPVYIHRDTDPEGVFTQVATLLPPQMPAPGVPIARDLNLVGSGQMECYITALSIDGIESEFSNILSFYAPKAPMRLRIAGATVSLESSDDMEDWKVEEVFYMDRSARRRFYRTSFDF